MDDPYLYPNTDILINKFDIDTLDTLNSFEADLLKDHSDYVRNALVAASAVFHDLGDKSNPEYLVAIIKDAIERGQTL